eukprot:5269421-Prymnesium_polylepis.1
MPRRSPSHPPQPLSPPIAFRNALALCPAAALGLVASADSNSSICVWDLSTGRGGRDPVVHADHPGAPPTRAACQRPSRDR